MSSLKMIPINKTTRTIDTTSQTNDEIFCRVEGNYPNRNEITSLLKCGCRYRQFISSTTNPSTELSTDPSTEQPPTDKADK